MSRTLEKWKQMASELKRESYVLCLAIKDPRVPWYAKFSALCVVAYVLSSIDLIPDFVPVLGYLDDIILVPLGITLSIKMMPSDVLVEARVKAQTQHAQDKFLGRFGTAFIIAAWLAIGIGLVLYFRSK